MFDPDKSLVIGVLIFPGYDVLDMNGPVRMFGTLADTKNVKIHLISEKGGKVKSAQQIDSFATHSFEQVPNNLNILLIPGGQGTRTEFQNPASLNFLKAQIPKVEYILTVCTGAAMVANTGFLDGFSATTNKLAYNWVVSTGPNVKWIFKARWVKDGKFYTSAGVSAGMDMALGFITDIYGVDMARSLAVRAEYEWHENSQWDPFSDIYNF
ncbi:hypothetical protein G9A89_009213 [Geosiphon pyriformis]|nr:hypothetical protein G9A89_009213 [Geosiphon pyriformis]